MYRTAYLAGSWYPASERDCREAIEGHAAEAKPEQASWRALIGPHAGWFYSGDVAGHAYRWLAEAQPHTDIVVVFGAHRGPRGPSTLFRARGWHTPLGPLETARELIEPVSAALDLPDEPVTPTTPDNAAEAHLPFVRYFFPKARLLTLGVAASPEATHIGEVIGSVCKQSGACTVFIGSTDLTHYGPNYGFSPVGVGPEAARWVKEENDKGFLDHLIAGRVPALMEHASSNLSACCPGAVAATLAAARVYGDAGRRVLVDHSLSCDVQPGPSFVGYAGIVL